MTVAQGQHTQAEPGKPREEQGRVYFPNLDGLRFIAALLVIIHHVEQLKSIYGIPNHWNSPFVQIIGEQGVVLFFVLSGFLITYLLLEEEKTTGTIKVKNFYLRRILRIWPLYFLLVFIALAILPQIPMFVLPGFDHEYVYRHLLRKVLLFLFFLPNLVSPLAGIVPFAAQTWSIGTEEQFYLAWPVVMKHVRKHRIALMLLIIFGYIFVARALYSSRTDFLPFKEYINTFWLVFNIDCMAIGGFFALLLHSRHKLLKYFNNNWIFYTSLVIVSYMLSRGISIQHLYKESYALFFGLLILNFAANPNIHVSLETGFLKYLGKISYGLYMYHPIGIAIVLTILRSTGWFSDYVIYPLSLALSIGIAGFSYQYFESFFLKLKTNYTTVKSGDAALAKKQNKVLLEKTAPQ
jgi:peptidoglycan/LPS O-acetylase OafA/YrhL